MERLENAGGLHDDPLWMFQEDSECPAGDSIEQRDNVVSRPVAGASPGDAEQRLTVRAPKAAAGCLPPPYPHILPWPHYHLKGSGAGRGSPLKQFLDTCFQMLAANRLLKHGLQNID